MNLEKNNLPFTEKKVDNIYERTFSKNIDENELKWHWDKEDRIVTSKTETDWLFQMDNELPIKIEKNKSIFIPEGQYHRIIKGTNDLVLNVRKLN